MLVLRLIHPEDLFNHLSTWKSDATVERPRIVDGRMEMGVAPMRPLSGCDWKYGWPHKFYVEGLPNLRGGELEYIYTYGQRERIAASALEGFQPEQYDRGNGDKGWRVVSMRSESPKHAHAKFYAEHLTDLQPEAFAALAALIEQHAQIRFSMQDGKLHWAAPRRGYQA